MQPIHSIPRRPRPEFVRRLGVECLEERSVPSANPLGLAVDLQAVPVVGSILEAADLNVEVPVEVESGLHSAGEGASPLGVGVTLGANVADVVEVPVAVAVDALPGGPDGQSLVQLLGATVDLGLGETGGVSVGVELPPNGDNAVEVDLGGTLGDGPDLPALPPELPGTPGELPGGVLGGLLGQGGGLVAGSDVAAETIPTPPTPVVTASVPTPAPVNVLAEDESGAASGSAGQADATAEDLSGSAAVGEQAAVAAASTSAVDRVFTLSSGGEAVGVESAQAEKGPGLVTEFAPGDGGGLEAAFRRLLDDMNELGEEVGGALLSREVALWLLTSAAAALACQAYGRRRNRKGKKPPHESGLSARKALSGSAGFTPVVG